MRRPINSLALGAAVLTFALIYLVLIPGHVGGHADGIGKVALAMILPALILAGYAGAAEPFAVFILGIAQFFLVYRFILMLLLRKPDPEEQVVGCPAPKVNVEETSPKI